MSKRRKFWFVVTTVAVSLFGTWIIMIAEPIAFIGWCLALCAPMFALEWIVKNVHIKEIVREFICALHCCEQNEHNYQKMVDELGDDQLEIEILTENWSAMHPEDIMIRTGYRRWVAKWSYKLWRWAKY